jgi:pilus assembly protein CpaD
MTFVLRAMATCGRIGRLAAVAAVAGMLGGCYTTSAQRTADMPPDDYRQRHPITLQERTRRVEVFVGTARGGLTPVQRAEVTAFAQTWQREATGGIVIDLPSGTPNARAAADSLREIQTILSATGVPSQGVAVRPYRPAEATKLATIRLNYPRIAADAGPCGLWPHDLGPADVEVYAQNKEYWNFGCATQRNLAAMVDNPADLVQPRAEGEVYAARRATVLDKYKQGQSTATTYPNANKGQISNVGN